MVEPISATLVATKEIAVEEVAETVVKEYPVKSVMDTIENGSLETLKFQNIETLNSNLEGKIHPKTDIPFIRKTVENFEGDKVSGVFPDFNEYKQFEVKLPNSMLQASDSEQFEYCNSKLKDSFDKGTLNTDKFTERQLEQIKNGDKPENFTWHHNEVKGRMELVNSNIHQATAHTGGKSIWGGGKEAR